MGRRLVAEAGKLVFYNTFALERLHPVNLVEGTVGRGQPLSHTFFSTMAGGSNPKLGMDGQVLVAAHYVPGHFCLAFVDFDREKIMYIDPFYDFDKAGDHRKMGLEAMRELRKHVHEELVRQGSKCDVRTWEMLGLKAPKQPDGVSCGVCVLIMIELITTEGVGALYDLDKQCENLSASGHTEVAIDTTKVFVQWTEHYINTKRIEYACRLVNRQSVRSR